MLGEIRSGYHLSIIFSVLMFFLCSYVAHSRREPVHFSHTVTIGDTQFGLGEGAARAAHAGARTQDACSLTVNSPDNYLLILTHA